VLTICNGLAAVCYANFNCVNLQISPDHGFRDPCLSSTVLPWIMQVSLPLHPVHKCDRFVDGWMDGQTDQFCHSCHHLMRLAIPANNSSAPGRCNNDNNARDLRSFEIQFDSNWPFGFDSKFMRRFENFRIARRSQTTQTINSA